MIQMGYLNLTPQTILKSISDIKPVYRIMDCENILRKGILTTLGGNIFFRTAEIVSIKPLYPPILGDSYSWGTPPDPRQEGSWTSLSAVSKIFAV